MPGEPLSPSDFENARLAGEFSSTFDFFHRFKKYIKKLIFFQLWNRFQKRRSASTFEIEWMAFSRVTLSAFYLETWPIRVEGRRALRSASIWNQPSRNWANENDKYHPICWQLHNAVRDSALLWPSGIIPYVISASFGKHLNKKIAHNRNDTFDSTDKSERILIARAFLQYQNKTCLRFVPRSSEDDDYLKIIDSNG